MFYQNEFYFWKISHYLMDQYEFDLIQVDERNHEIWLEGVINKKRHVIRLFMHDFDWTNHLKKDLAYLIERIKKVKGLLRGKDVEVHNIYISQYPPVDDWYSVKKPIVVKERKNLTIHTHFFVEEGREEEIGQFFHSLSLEKPNISVPASPEESHVTVQYIKHRVISQHQKRKKEASALFSYGKPFLTYILLLVNVVVFLLMENAGDSTDTFHLIEWGAKFNPYIIDGEWWRIVSSMFIHVGYLHLLMNMLALYYLGNAVERMYGSFKFFIIYFLAGVFGGLASFSFNTSVAAGASGAIFGLFGALLFFGLINRKLFFQTMGSNLLFIIGLNIVLGISVPSIDNSAHMGGLIGGFLAAAIVQMPRKRNILLQVASLLVYVFVIGSLVYYGTENTKNSHDPNIQLVLAQKELDEKNYSQAIELLTKGIHYADDSNEYLYFNRSLAYIYLDEWEKAKDDLVKAVTINESLAEGHYNLALVYSELAEYENAFTHAEKAASIRPDDSQFQRVKEKLREVRDSLN
ncbi:rhomboid protease GluP [Salirhabdus euzebyi]|uniref:Rhomboid protease GluP n=1 Tax=Salirhabdus euzebyi TaxID=394506 RepID=A0A841Q7F7_9BACI|nr:rhomboid family intramembrane serine protease [Salirhabdus euzebyi]MBB6454273.1 rhomboid protease GluP [Salirhabdus euzebyi]